jgi:diguanylate cyclase (GGDEF)-like protein
MSRSRVSSLTSTASRKPSRYGWAALAVAVIVALVVVYFYAREQQTEDLRATVVQNLGEQANYLTDELESHLSFVMDDLRGTYAAQAPASQAAFSETTRHLLSAVSFLIAINYVGSDRRIMYTSPLEGNEAVVGLLVALAAPQQALEQAAATGLPALSPPFEIIQGEQGYSLMTPGPAGGFFEVVFPAAAILAPQNPIGGYGDLALEIMDAAGTVISRASDYPTDNRNTVTATLETTLFNRTLILEGAARPNLTSSKETFWRVMGQGSLAASLGLVVVLLSTQTVWLRRYQRVQRQLNHVVRRDPLTDAYNRRFLEELLAQEEKRARRYEHPLTFVMVDVNRFKEINDRFGHAMGDRVLQEIASLLQEAVRESDYVIRYGGDEFLVVLPETGNKGVEATVQRIQAKMAERNKTNPLVDFPVTLAIGTASWSPLDERLIEAVLSDADQQMYAEKKRTSAS